MAAIVARARPEARFLCVGKGDPALEADLKAQTERLGLADRLVWTGARGDMAAIYSALDLSVSSSAYGEGTPNVVAESMACGAPCVVTDSGDSAWTAGGFGAVTPKNDPEALAAAVLAVLDRPPDRAAVRQSIIDRLSLDLLCQRTEAALTQVLAAGVRPVAAEPTEALP
jgi:glycosyltransferase involved in cell wall biosynthesis